MTKQKLHAVLRKAGHTKATYERSGQVRGWGSWSRGYNIDTAYRGGEVFEIRYMTGSFRGNDELEATEIQRIAASLDAAQIPYTKGQYPVIFIEKDA